MGKALTEAFTSTTNNDAREETHESRSVSGSEGCVHKNGGAEVGGDGSQGAQPSHKRDNCSPTIVAGVTEPTPTPHALVVVPIPVQHDWETWSKAKLFQVVSSSPIGKQRLSLMQSL